MAPLEYVQIHVYYNPHMDTGTRTRVNVNAPLDFVRQNFLQAFLSPNHYYQYAEGRIQE